MDNYIFYNEREWRFIPEGAQIISERQFNTQRDMYNEQIRNTKLIFTPDDFKYVIIQEETEIDEMIRAIPIVKGRYEEDSIKRLISRIITYDQIRFDF